MPTHPPSAVPFRERFLRVLHDLGLDAPDAPLLVALSGGCDSVVLLHLLRFVDPTARRPLSAAHLDHRMREGSRADAAWVAGLCRAWNVTLVVDAVRLPLRGETDARRERYRFLRETASALGAERILTAHHADDQAETVLFRALRGTGLRGLAGMAAAGSGGVYRPLLQFRRTELRRYAREAGLRWREDPSNRSAGTPRNVLRNELFPRIERNVAPGARGNLVRLASLARDAEAGLAAALEPLRAQHVQEDAGALLLDRSAVRDLHPALSARLLRDTVHRLGSTLSAAGTRLAIQFITDAASGREVYLPGGVRISTEFGTARLDRPTARPADLPARVEVDGEAGEASFRLAGRQYRVHWEMAPASAAEPTDSRSTELRTVGLAGPLELRGWRPGDRIRLRGGTRRLKRLFVDRRVPRADRPCIPVLTDRSGRVLWVAGLARSADAAPAPGEDALRISIGND